MPGYKDIRRRIQADSGITPEILRAQASAVDTYAPTKAGLQLSQLAEGLSALAPSLSRFADARREKDMKDAEEAGKAAALRAVEEKQTYLQAIKDGTIRADQSPHYRDAARAVFAQRAAQAAVTDLTLRARAELGDATDIAQFDRVEEESRAASLEKYFGGPVDEKTRTAFLASYQPDALNVRRGFASEIGNRLQAVTGENFGALVAEIAGKAKDESATPEQIATRVKEQADQMIAAGMDPRTANDRVVDGIITAALQSNDSSLLESLNHLTTDGTARVSNIRRYAERIQAAEDDIVNRRKREEDLSDSEKRRAQEAGRDELLESVGTAIAEGREVDWVDVGRKAAALKMPGLTPELLRVRDSFQEGAHSDPQVFTRLKVGVNRGDIGRAQVIAAYQRGEINRGEFNDLFGDARQLKAENRSDAEYRYTLSRREETEGSSRGQRYLNYPTVVRARAVVREMVELGVDDPYKGQRVANSSLEFDSRIIQYVQGGGDPNDLAKLNAIAKEVGEAHSYSRDSENFVADPKVGAAPHRFGVTETQWYDPNAAAAVGGSRPVAPKQIVDAMEHWVRTNGSLPPSQAMFLLRRGIDPRDKDKVRAFIADQRRKGSR